MSTARVRHALPRSDEFRAWLSTLGLEGRSLSDVVSRAGRTWGMISLQPPVTDADVEYRLASSDSFAACSRSVQSQLRRAAKLYARFASKGTR